jgi:hypothetical protein
MHPAFFASEYEERAKKMRDAASRAEARGNLKKARKFAASAERWQRKADKAFAELEDMGIRRPTVG